MAKNVALKQIASNQSLAASFTSEVTTIQWLDNISYQINIDTSNSEGTFVVEASLDYVPANNVQNAQANAGNWFALQLSGGTPAVEGQDDVIGIDLNQLPYRAIRLRYISTVAGTGTCNIFINCRQLGGN